MIASVKLAIVAHGGIPSGDLSKLAVLVRARLNAKSGVETSGTLLRAQLIYGLAPIVDTLTASVQDFGAWPAERVGTVVH